MHRIRCSYMLRPYYRGPFYFLAVSNFFPSGSLQKPITDRLGEAYENPAKVVAYLLYPMKQKNKTTVGWITCTLFFFLDRTGIAIVLGHWRTWRGWQISQRCCPWTFWELRVAFVWKSFIQVWFTTTTFASCFRTSHFSSAAYLFFSSKVV